MKSNDSISFEVEQIITIFTKRTQKHKHIRRVSVLCAVRDEQELFFRYESFHTERIFLRMLLFIHNFGSCFLPFAFSFEHGNMTLYMYIP